MEVVEQCYILSADTRDQVASEIHTNTHHEHLPIIEEQWMPILYALAQPLAEHVTSKEELKEALTTHNIVDAGWDWNQIVHQNDGTTTRKTFYLIANETVQGVLHAKFPKISVLREGSDLVYVDFVAVAPWNRDLPGQSKRFRGVGTNLISKTIELSKELGYKGIIGLHSLIQAEPYYSCIGMTPIERDPGYGNMLYFEFTEDGINGLLGEEV